MELQYRSPALLARTLLEDELPRRWAHTQGVAARASHLRDDLCHVWHQDADLVVAAAWLHDIGYAAHLAESGFHPLDGARYLRDNGLGTRQLCTLVARHTCAEIEAEARGLGAALDAEFPADAVDSVLISAVTFCDMTTGPDGAPMDVEERLAEILERYSPDDPVHRSITEAAPSLRRQVSEITALRANS